jgi:hypothetical protein
MAYSQEFLQEMTNAQDSFVWEAPSWEEHDRSTRWYIWMSVVVVALTVYAVATANYLFAFIVLLTAVILILAGNERPRAVLVQIGHNGVVYDGRLFQYDKLSDFAIVYHPPHTKVLYFQPKNAVKARLRISLEDEDPVAIRNHLKTYLEEDLDLRDEHMSDIFGRLLRI